MNVAVIGLGNVGLVAALCLAKQGHKVKGVEVHPIKVEMLERKESYIFEPGLQEILLDTKNFEAVQKIDSYEDCEAFIVCVGTPARADGSVELNHVLKTVNELASAIKEKKSHSLVIIRSTIPPGTMEKHIAPFFEGCSDIELIFHPEFLREGSAVNDFLSPEYHVVGQASGKENHSNQVEKLFGSDCPIHYCEYSAAEMLKYINNSFHGLKVAFANEIASIAAAMNVNISQLTELFLADTKQNISPMYLRPGFSFGGPCLTKELKALGAFARQNSIAAPLVSATLDSNNAHSRRLMETLDRLSARRILFVGLSFKPNTDDLRDSPLKETLEYILRRPSYQKSGPLYACDMPSVQSQLKHYPDLVFIKDPTAIIDDLDVIVLGPYKLSDESIKQLEKFRGRIIDLGYFQYNHPNKENILYAYDGVRP